MFVNLATEIITPSLMNFNSRNRYSLSSLFLDLKGLSIIDIPFTFGVVAQLVRAPACHAGGRGFESRLSRHFMDHFSWVL